MEVGFGQAVITPPMPVVLAGFGARKGLVSEVHDDLEVHAVVFRTEVHAVCLLVLDLLLLGPDVAGPIRAAVAEALHLPTSAVLTSCTHTHSGPAATRSMRRIGWPMPDEYGELLVARCVEAAQLAWQAAEPAVLRYGRGELPGDLSLNRRGLPYAPQACALDVLRPDGSRVGSIGNVGIHPVALGIECRAISGDWVTSYRAAGRRITGAPTVLLQGALGDVNPTRDPHTDPTAGGNWDTARELGDSVAEVVGDLLARATAVESARVESARVESARVASDAVVPTVRIVSPRAGLTVPALLAGRALRRVEVELVEWRLGDLTLVSLPGEAFHALGRAVERARDDRVLLAGVAPTWLGYLPEPFGKGYEEKMSYGRRFVHAVAQALVTPRLGGGGA
jgi:hypothetical protein